MLTPTAPASITSATARDTSSGAGPWPASMSAVTGTSPAAATISAITVRAAAQGRFWPSA
jgi:hypothetical protein